MTIGFSPLTMNLNGTFDSLMHPNRNTVASTYPKNTFKCKRKSDTAVCIQSSHADPAYGYGCQPDNIVQSLCLESFGCPLLLQCFHNAIRCFFYRGCICRNIHSLFLQRMHDVRYLWCCKSHFPVLCSVQNTFFGTSLNMTLPLFITIIRSTYFAISSILWETRMTVMSAFRADRQS